MAPSQLVLSTIFDIVEIHSIEINLTHTKNVLKTNKIVALYSIVLSRGGEMFSPL